MKFCILLAIILYSFQLVSSSINGSEPEPEPEPVESPYEFDILWN